VVDLLPLLVDVCAAGHQSEGARWELGPMGGLAFDPAKSLGQIGVLPGTLLHLRSATATPEAVAGTDDGVPWPPPWPSDGDGPLPGTGARPGIEWARRDHVVLPQDRTRLMLPPRVGLPSRVAGAVRAAVRRPPPGDPGLILEPRPGEVVSPASLSVHQLPGPAMRLRHSWRSTDYLNRLDEAIVGPQLKRCATIAVMSPKGGVGKTTISVLLGTLLALLRRDRIVAIDSNPDFGSLGRQLAPTHAVFVDDLLEVLDEPQLTATTLDNHLARTAHGLMVLPAPTDPDRAALLDVSAYTRVVHKLQQMVGVIVLDTGAGLYEPAARAAMATADQVVLVSDAESATASLVAEAAALLKREGLPLWLVVNKTGVPSNLDLRAYGAKVSFAHGLVELRSDVKAARRVADGAFRWEEAPGAWKQAVRELVAALVVAWPDLGIAA
jgi:MinD-like ATPase involved in chromosome partitioning or flagellar assembly